MSNIFRLAIRYIPTDPSDARAVGVCAALARAHIEEGTSHIEWQKAKAEVDRRLGHHAWVTSWLRTHQPGFCDAWDTIWTNWDIDKYRASPLWKEVQAYRVRWCEHLADEVDAGRIKL